MKNDLQSDVEHRESEINKETNIEENNNFLESNDVKPLSAPERATQVYDLVQITYSRFLKLHKGPDDLQSWTPVSNSKSGLIVTKKIINLNSIGSPITTTNNFWQPTTNSTSAALLPLYKGTKVLCGKSVEEVFSVIRSYGCRKKWDDTFEDGRLLEYCGEGVDISSVSLKPYFPLSRRNLTVVNSITRIKNTLNSYTPPNENYKLLNNNSSVVFTSCSIPPDCLTKESWKKLKEFEKSGIRAELIFSAWVLEPLDPYDSETKYPIPSTRVTYYVQMDLGTAYSFFMGSFPSCINGLEKYCNKIPPYVEWPKTGKVEKVSVQKSSNLRVMDTLFDEETGTYTLYCDSSIYCEKAGNLQASATEELLIQFIVNLSVYPNQYEIEWTFDHIKISEKETTDFKPKLRFEIMELDPTLLEEKSENHSTRRSSFSEKALYQPRHLISVYFVNKELKLLEKPDKNVSDGPQAALELKDRFYFEEKSVELKKDGNYIKFKFVIKKSTLPLTSLIDREKFYIFVNGFKTLIKSRNNNDNSNIKVDEKIFEKPSSNLSSSIGSSSTSPINIDKKSIRKYSSSALSTSYQKLVDRKISKSSMYSAFDDDAPYQSFTVMPGSEKISDEVFYMDGDAFETDNNEKKESYSSPNRTKKIKKELFNESSSSRDTKEKNSEGESNQVVYDNQLERNYFEKKSIIVKIQFLESSCGCFKSENAFDRIIKFV